jgi:hypothetical protein
MAPRSSRKTALIASSSAPATTGLVFMMTSLLLMNGCAAIKGIFEVGFGVGVVVVIAVVVATGGLFAMLSRK